MHSRLGSVTLSQPAFPGEGKPNFLWQKSHWDNIVVRSKKKKRKSVCVYVCVCMFPCLWLIDCILYFQGEVTEKSTFSLNMNYSNKRTKFKINVAMSQRDTPQVGTLRLLTVHANSIPGPTHLQH